MMTVPTLRCLNCHCSAIVACDICTFYLLVLLMVAIMTKMDDILTLLREALAQEG